MSVSDSIVATTAATTTAGGGGGDSSFSAAVIDNGTAGAGAAAAAAASCASRAADAADNVYGEDAAAAAAAAATAAAAAAAAEAQTRTALQEAAQVCALQAGPAVLSLNHPLLSLSQLSSLTNSDAKPFETKYKARAVLVRSIAARPAGRPRCCCFGRRTRKRSQHHTQK
eukprot:COSAG01_NODE_558_length_15478_cov_217.596788_5_plen_170_part_00